MTKLGGSVKSSNFFAWIYSYVCQELGRRTSGTRAREKGGGHISGLPSATFIGHVALSPYQLELERFRQL